LKAKTNTFYLILLMLLLLGGCQKAEQDTAIHENETQIETQTETENTAYTFEDDLGRTITVDQPQRVASLLGSFAEVWMLAGGDVCATADDAWDNIGRPLAEDTVNLGMTKEVDLEKLFAAEPDFVIASANTDANLEMMETLENAAIPVAYFDVSDFDDYLHMLQICTEITGRDDLYEKNGLEVREQIEAVVAQSEQRLEGREAPSVLLLRASSASIRAKNSRNNVLGEMLATLGCHNIADSDAMLLEELNVESIIQADPDLIFVVPLGDDVAKAEANIDAMFAENPAWSQLSAVSEDRVFIMDKMLYNFKPNARWGEAYEKLEALLDEQTGQE